jgi:hypothetical protein
VTGESPGYDLQVAFMSLGLEELGLASADIQLDIPCCPYSYARLLEDLESEGWLSLPDGFMGGAMFWMGGIAN